MMLAFAALLCLASGFVLVSMGWFRRSPPRAALPLMLWLSIGYGLGIFSVVFLLSRIFVANLIVADVALFAVLLVAWWAISRSRPRLDAKTASSNSAQSPKWLRQSRSAAFAIALCSALYSLVMRALADPHGDGWDAFTTWNLHARFLFRGGLNWRDGFTPLHIWTHPDYPLLLPAAIAHFWSYLGRDEAAVPAIIGLIFTVATVGVLFSALSLLRGRTPAMLAATALLATPFFIELGTSQYADVPLAFYFLATVVLLCLYDSRPVDAKHSPGLLVLAGLAAGFAAW